MSKVPLLLLLFKHERITLATSKLVEILSENFTLNVVQGFVINLVAGDIGETLYYGLLSSMCEAEKLVTVAFVTAVYVMILFMLTYLNSCKFGFFCLIFSVVCVVVVFFFFFCYFPSFLYFCCFCYFCSFIWLYVTFAVSFVTVHTISSGLGTQPQSVAIDVLMYVSSA